jgi:hypothetical protein
MGPWLSGVVESGDAIMVAHTDLGSFRGAPREAPCVLEVPLLVECYAGYRGDEAPRRIEIDGRVIEVVDTIRRWQKPAARDLRVRSNEGRVHALRHDEHDDQWTVLGM